MPRIDIVAAHSTLRHWMIANVAPVKVPGLIANLQFLGYEIERVRLVDTSPPDLPTFHVEPMPF
jgi:hypothetical protein